MKQRVSVPSLWEHIKDCGAARGTGILGYVSSQLLIDRFSAECQAAVVTGPERENLLAGEGVRILFITGDVEKRLEVGDLTVILREILRDYAGRVRVALADRAEEKLFRDSFAIKVLPTLVVFRDGKPMGLIPGLKKWEEYIDMVKRLLGEEPVNELEINPFLEVFLETKRFTNF